MKREQALDLIIDGDLIKDKSISLRVLGNILPDLQRSIDKIVLLEKDGKYKRGSAVHKKDRELADLYLSEIKDGSLILPLAGAIKTKAIKLYQWAIDEPYKKALVGESGVRQELAARNMEAQQKAGVYEIRTQEDVIKESAKDYAKFARAAALSDLHRALDPVRSAGNNILKLKFVRPATEAEYVFDRDQAVRFGNVVYKNYLTKPAIYTGKIRGTKERASNDGFGYEADLLSSVSKQNQTVYVRTEEQIRLLAEHAYGEEISFWASPLERYGGFDPYNGPIVFISLA